MGAYEENLIVIENLKKVYPVPGGMFSRKPLQLNALNGVSLTIKKKETLGLVGESGCGKSTLGRIILQLIPKTEGKIYFGGCDMDTLNASEIRKLRRYMQMIFQDPYSSLNPRMTVLDLVKAPLDVFSVGTKQERMDRVVEMLKLVDLNENYLYRYPHEFSGGQRQRIGIARALILQPEFVVCDEPVSALDVSVRASTLNLLKSLQKKMGLTSLFISHDLSVVKHISDRVGVMYLGKIVELADKDEIYENPVHPYTKALLAAIPVPDAEQNKPVKLLQGDPPSPYELPAGCKFQSRCPWATEECRLHEPELKDIGNGHYAACHLSVEEDDYAGKRYYL